MGQRCVQPRLFAQDADLLEDTLDVALQRRSCSRRDVFNRLGVYRSFDSGNTI